MPCSTRDDSGAVLARTHADTQLVVAIDPDDGGRYRYHHPLLEALRGDLLNREPELEPQLHRRAAR